MENNDMSRDGLFSCKGTVAKKRYLVTGAVAFFAPLILHAFLSAFTELRRATNVEFYLFVEAVGVVLFAIGLFVATCNSAKRFRTIGVSDAKSTLYALCLLFPGLIGKIIVSGLPTRTLLHADYAPALYSFIGYWINHLGIAVGSMLLYSVILSICITLYMEKKANGKSGK